jgi:hypothetical protein
MYLIPPMDDEPPPDYVDYVTAHVGDLRRETDQLVGGDPEGGHLYLDVLADLAGHWRRLRLLSRLSHRDRARPYLTKRLAVRAKHWREEQIYEVEIRVLHPQHAGWAPQGRSSLALRKAAVIPGTRRSGVILAVADAGIAWVHAYRRYQWRRAGLTVAACVLVVGGFIQYVSWASSVGS